VSAAPDATPAVADRGSRRARVGIAALLGLIVVWFTWDAVGNLLGLPELYAQLGLEQTVPWVALLLGVAMPPVYYVAALLLARRASLQHFALVLIAALGAIAVARLTLIVVTTGTLTGIG